MKMHRWKHKEQLKSTPFWIRKNIYDKYLFMKALLMLLGYKVSSHIIFLGECESAV